MIIFAPSLNRPHPDMGAKARKLMIVSRCVSIALPPADTRCLHFLFSNK